jgi:hypothetical protein
VIVFTLAWKSFGNRFPNDFLKGILIRHSRFWRRKNEKNYALLLCWYVYLSTG